MVTHSMISRSPSGGREARRSLTPRECSDSGQLTSPGGGCAAKAILGYRACAVSFDSDVAADHALAAARQPLERRPRNREARRTIATLARGQVDSVALGRSRQNGQCLAGLAERARCGAPEQADAKTSPPCRRRLPVAERQHPLYDASYRRFVVEVTTLEAPQQVVNFELSLDDYHAMLRHVCSPGRSERRLWFGAVFLASFSMAVFGRDGRVLLVGMVVGFLLMLVRGLRTQRRLRPRSGGAVLCCYDVQLRQGGVRVETPNWASDVPWHGILAVEETATHCFLRVDAASVYTIPNRSFANGEAMRQFIDVARDCMSRVRIAGNARGLADV